MESRESRLPFRIIGGEIHEHADAPHAPPCARAASGHAAALPRSVMNSRRFN
jgi:hypothetical protein